jgi:UDP-N-acetyl-D-galactosamine dehydrogenase
VPTPIDAANRPDLRPLQSASEALGSCSSAATSWCTNPPVYPGCTEESVRADPGARLRAEIQRRTSTSATARAHQPGDRKHKLHNIMKVTSGSTPEAAAYIDGLYASIVTAGTHRASSIRVAEAAKVIENTQRDLNIALVNELALIFNQMGIDTLEVLEAAGTKWNFLPFRPAWSAATASAWIRTTSRTRRRSWATTRSDPGRPAHQRRHGPVRRRAGVALMTRRSISMPDARVLRARPGLQGKLPGPAQHARGRHRAPLPGLHVQVDVHDPWVDAAEAKHEYGIDLVAKPSRAATTRSWSRSRTASSPRSGEEACARSASPARCCTT